MAYEVHPFGYTQNGEKIQLYLLTNSNGMIISVTNQGACLQSVIVPDANGRYIDVALGYDGAIDYFNNSCFLGAIVGRYGNRISGANFSLDGIKYQLNKNEGNNSVHSGPDFWFKRIWEIYKLPKDSEDGSVSMTFALKSPEGDQGFPGEVNVRVTYRLSSDNKLSIIMYAKPSCKTLLNLACHPYWNLNGYAAGSILKHVLQVNASKYTPVDDELIPTGEIASVIGTPYDFMNAKYINTNIDKIKGGYDINYVLGYSKFIKLAATLTSKLSGITMKVYTDAPGIQLYTSGNLKADGKSGAHFGEYDAIVLEPQFYPDSPHHENFPQPIFTSNHPFESTTTFAFYVND